MSCVRCEHYLPSTVQCIVHLTSPAQPCLICLRHANAVAGGQRLVQCVVYLNTLSKGGGGGTAFHHPCLKGLIVQPQQGNALVFFPASKDGTMDARMTHSGLPVLAGEKWIINTWAMQHDRPKDP